MTVSDFFDTALVGFVVRSLIPILLAALGGLICQRSGVFNVALEGLMLIGAFAAVTASFFSGSWVFAIVVAITAGMLTSLVLAYGAVHRRGDAVVIGIALNLLAVGVTGVLLKAIFNVAGILQSDQVVGIPTLLPDSVVRPVPFLGDALATATLITLMAFAFVPAVQWGLYRTVLGLRLRGVGEHAEAAATLGVDPVRLQYLAVLVSGALCGLAGAQLALGNIVKFAEQMTAGRGWIAVVAVMLGRARPIPTFLACLLFAVADAIGFRLQGANLPTQITEAAPYVVTLVALIAARQTFQARGAHA